MSCQGCLQDLPRRPKKLMLDGVPEKDKAKEL
jgi:hypothetical protein